jgi:hypothetical protein
MKGGRDRVRYSLTFCMILGCCRPAKKEQTEVLWKLYMCLEFTIFKIPEEC